MQLLEKFFAREQKKSTMNEKGGKYERTQLWRIKGPLLSQVNTLQ
jgi:hypothetical protein